MVEVKSDGKRTQTFVMILVALVVICMATAVGILHLASLADDGLLAGQAELFSFSVLPTVHARQLSASGRKEPEAVYTMDLVYETFEGTDVGQKTLDGLCRQLEIEPRHARYKLQQRGVTIGPDERLGDAARRYGVNPVALLQALLVGEKVRSSQRRTEEVPRLRFMP